MMKRLQVGLAGLVSVLLMTAPVSAVVQQDVLLNNSNQIVTMSTNPFFGTQQDIAAVNFFYNGTGLAAGSTVNGVGFDNINLTVPSSGPFALYNNVPGIGMTLNLGFTSDNTERQQNLAAAGPSAAALNTVADRMFYVGGTNHANPQMSFSGLGANRNVYVQLIGGDQGWNGDLAVTANGGGVGGNWTTVADSSANNGSLFAFNTTTSATGTLDLGFSIAGGNFAGISGIVLSGEGVVAAPAPPTQAALTNTAQILAPDAAFDTLAAAVNFRYSSQPGVAGPGTVNGISFQDIDWLGGTQALAQGGDITITGPGGDRSRFQTTASTIFGPDEAVLESIANTINYLGAGESVTFDLTGLEANKDVRLQIIGGDAGGNLGNWLGDFDVSVNGDSVLWDIVADDNLNTASLLTFFGTTDAAGNLEITLDQVNAPPGQFAGIAGLTVTQAAAAVPEPTSVLLWVLLGAAGVIGVAWRRRG